MGCNKILWAGRLCNKARSGHKKPIPVLRFHRDWVHCISSWLRWGSWVGGRGCWWQEQLLVFLRLGRSRRQCPVCHTVYFVDALFFVLHFLEGVLMFFIYYSFCFLFWGEAGCGVVSFKHFLFFFDEIFCCVHLNFKISLMRYYLCGLNHIRRKHGFLSLSSQLWWISLAID